MNNDVSLLIKYASMLEDGTIKDAGMMSGIVDKIKSFAQKFLGGNVPIPKSKEEAINVLRENLPKLKKLQEEQKTARYESNVLKVNKGFTVAQIRGNKFYRERDQIKELGDFIYSKLNKHYISKVEDVEKKTGKGQLKKNLPPPKDPSGFTALLSNTWLNKIEKLVVDGKLVWQNPTTHDEMGLFATLKFTDTDNVGSINTKIVFDNKGNADIKATVMGEGGLKKNQQNSDENKGQNQGIVGPGGIIDVGIPSGGEKPIPGKSDKVKNDIRRLILIIIGALIVLLPSLPGSFGGAKGLSDLAQGKITPSAIVQIEKGIGNVGKEAPAKNMKVQFDFNKSDIKDSEAQKIEELAKDLKGKDVTVTLTGHASTQGDADYNMALSQKRTEAVAKSLEKYGIKVKVKKSIGEEGADSGASSRVVDVGISINKSANRRMAHRVASTYVAMSM